MTSIIVPINSDTSDLLDSWAEAERNGVEFPVPFDEAWAIAGYSKKANGKRALSDLADGVDFCSQMSKSNGGRASRIFSMTCDAFKAFCLMAKTDEGKLIRSYFIDAEKKWKLTQQIAPKVAYDVELLSLQIELAKIELQRQQSSIETDRHRELVLVNENLRMDLSRLERIDSMATLHGVATTLTLMGREGAMIEVEKPVIEVIDDRHNQAIKYRGQTCAQLKDYMKKRFGIIFKSGADVQKVLEKKENELGISLIGQLPRTVNQSYVPDEFSEQAIEILRDVKSWQCLLGQ